MRIITIGREFGSGGRELGKRLAEALHISYYDKEIIEIIAKEHGFDEKYVSHISESSINAAYPRTIGHRFAVSYQGMDQSVKATATQQKIIRNFAGQGDCVIVGRCADVILGDLHPMNIFVYANQESKVARCVSRSAEGEKLPRSRMEQMMRQVDKDRAKYREMLTDTHWGEKEAYHLCVNTSGKDIKTLIPVLAEYATRWFE